MNKYDFQRKQKRVGTLIFKDSKKIVVGLHSANDDGTVTYIDKDGLNLLQEAYRNNPQGMSFAENPEANAILNNPAFQKTVFIDDIAGFEEA